MAACALAEMSLSGGLMSKLIVQAGAVTPLLNICNIRKCKYLRPLALRILTVICSTQKAVEEFENVSFNVPTSFKWMFVYHLCWVVYYSILILQF